ncbi:tripartite tricarboxylate transporter TctB family protein [Arenibaculum pallidiluteum]|uniref:tripartite tricarboxylate transporter TctB family protein n=1 Tax=Arenibaculum pallidiluteum TaxID=2812559 RepID=UPI001A96B25C|nr:tripartite tricarboxylate transporter TctB family protein [Arenibaculum pallidiluteum]
MRINDAVTGGVLLASAVALGLYSSTLPATPGQDYGAAVFPMAIAILVGGLSLFLIASGARAWRGVVELPDRERSFHGPAKFALAFGSVLFYLLAAEPLGFAVCSVLIVFALCVSLGTRWWMAALVALGITAAIHVTFSDLLKVPLPLGILAPLVR